MSDSLQPRRLQLARHLCPWNSPGKNTGLGCHSLLQGIFPKRDWIQVFHIAHCRLVLYHLGHKGSPRTLQWIAYSFSKDLLPYPGIEPGSPALQTDSLPAELPRKPAFTDFAVVQLLSHIQIFVTAWPATRQASLSFTNSQSLLKLLSIELVMTSNHLVLCHSLLLQPSIFPSICFFFNESTLFIKWSKYCNFSISPFNEYSGLIFFKIDWFHLLVVQGALNSFL